ncbi:MAG: hypothetical protein KJ927_04445 [Candidatus Eisenbacteria bacterium]|nr:hypothetical protein [Candidatus Eisenbacteria bacterium]
MQGSPVDMVILTENTWTDGTSFDGDMTRAFQVWADWRTVTGIPTVVRSLSWIRENYSGGDDPERIREFLKEAYSLWGTDFVILGGDVEVVPSRTSLYEMPYAGEDGQDPSSDWYYAGLDSDWDQDNNGFYSWTYAVDVYPELWIGRIPARDSLEATAIIEKLQTYERVPGLGLDTPPDSFYTKAVLAAGLTNYSAWDLATDDSYKWWHSGIRQAEAIKRNILDEVSPSFSTVQLYPDLGTTASCGGTSLECYKDIKDAFDTYPSEPGFTAANVRDYLNANAAIFFHMEHSGAHGLGGPSNGALTKPLIDDCLQNVGAGCTENGCLSWIDVCFDDYKTSNIFIGPTRELLSTMSNGPSYFVGASRGCSVARLDEDSVVETLVRDPDGGAVSMWGGSSLTGWREDSENQPATALQYFDYILAHSLPTGVSLYNAHLDNDSPTSFNRYSRLLCHLFGDPSMLAWSAVPDTLTLTSSMETFPSHPSTVPDTIIVKIGATPVENARVCLSKNDLYVIGRTDENGEAIFPALQLLDISDTLTIWASAPNVIPKMIQILPEIGMPGNHPQVLAIPLIYDSHEFSDLPDSSTKADFLEPGDLVDLTVYLHNPTLSTSSAGKALLGISPRIKTSMLINSEYNPDLIFIGKDKYNPPAELDTFSLIMNEYAFRPELEPNYMNNTGAIYIWRDTTFTYNVVAHYDTPDIGDSFSGVFITEGGIDVVYEGIDGSDEVSLTTWGSLDVLEFDFVGDATDDTLLFNAQAQNWIEVTADSAAYDTVSFIDGIDTTSVEFQFRIKPGMPTDWRLNMSVQSNPPGSNTDPTFSDFYTTIHTPDLVLNCVEIDSLDGLWDCGYTAEEFGARPRVWNRGDAATGDLLLTLEATGANISVYKDTLWLDLEAGEEDWTHGEFLFCDDERTFRITSLTAAREVDGDMDTLGVWENLDPWPLNDYWVEVPDIDVEPMNGGLRVRWDEAPGEGNILGYYVYRDSATVVRRVTGELLIDTFVLQLNDLEYKDGAGNPLSYTYGVSAVTNGLYEGPITWAGSELTTLQDRSGWPIRVPKGCVTSVVLADIDRESSLEIIVGGRVISAWNLNGTPAYGGDGTLYDPIPDDSEFDQPNFEFHGDLAAGDIDHDGKDEIVGCFGDDSLLVIDSDGDRLWSARVHARSTPTLADLDDDDNLEIILNGCDGGSLFVFREDGETYWCNNTNGLFADAPQGDTYNWGNYAGVGVADLNEDGELDIIQPLPSGYVYAWDSDTTGCPAGPDSLWDPHYVGCPGCPLSTPALGHVYSNGNTYLDVVFAARNVQWYPVQTIDGNSGDPLGDFWFYRGSGVDSLVIFERPSQPSLGDLGGSSDTLEVVISRQADKDSIITYDPITKVTLLWVYDGEDHITTCLDSIPLPGRRYLNNAVTQGSPLLADIDDDGRIEILVPSMQGGLFCWEAIWDSESHCFECEPESGWPIVYPENPGTPIIADPDNDGYFEMIVPVGDYVHVYNLPSLTSSDDVLWGSAAHDSRRTGNTESGVLYRIQHPDGPEEILPGHGAAFLPEGPNPFKGQKILTFRVPFRTRISLDIYDTSGRKVRTLENRILDPGVYSLPWDGQSDGGHKVPAGVYFARYKAGRFELTEKLVLIR